jgi:hypothetical protein
MPRHQRNTDPVFGYLATDGRHVLAGRYVAPSEEELAETATKLAEQSLRGWLVQIVGDRWAKTPPKVLRLRALHEGLDDADFANALEAFVAAHRDLMDRLK